jgi:hypothetical protein
LDFRRRRISVLQLVSRFLLLANNQKPVISGLRNVYSIEVK